MYVHLGKNINIPEKEIIVIFNNKTGNKPCNRELIQHSFLEEICTYRRCNSFVITDEKIFLSPITSSTLYKRVMTKKYNNKLF